MFLHNNCPTIQAMLKRYYSKMDQRYPISRINSGIYQAHSLQSASTSSASYKGVNLSTILKSANWTRNSTFKKYYKKEIDQLYCDFRGKNEFANSLLSSF